MGPWKAYLAVFAFYGAASAAAAGVFVFAFGYGWLLIPLHLAVVMPLFIATTLLLGALVCVRRLPRRLTQGLIVLVPGALSAALLLLYVLDYAGNALWGSNATLPLIMMFLPRLGQLTQALPFPVGAIGAAAVVLLALPFVPFLWYSGRILAGLEELFLPRRPFSLFRDRRRALLTGVGAALIVAASCAAILGALRFPWGSWRGEPIISLFAPMAGGPDFDGDDAGSVFSIGDYPTGLAFDPLNIVLIFVDSLRADHMGIHGYERDTTPVLARLLETGRLRKVAFATSNYSCSVGGAFATVASTTAAYPGRDTGPFCTIHHLLREQGYMVRFILSDCGNTYPGLEAMYTYNLDQYADGTSSEQFPIGDDRSIVENLNAVPAYAGTPTFFYLWLMSAHYVGVHLPEYERYTPAKSERPSYNFRHDSEEEHRALLNRYDNGILQADDMIGQILEVLERKGYLDHAVVVILGDHGEAFGEHGGYLHSYFLYQENIGIPILILDSPDVAYANLEFASQVDVAPTILDRLGLPCPPAWEGRSLLEPDAAEYSFHTTMAVRQNRAVIRRGNSAIWKYLRSEMPPEGHASEELFELVTDPEERHDRLATADPALVADLRAAFDAHFFPAGTPEPAPTAVPGP
ncbi:MAG: sulfatase-like hydrolase/transferase [Candidatus Hydrogenedentes bacterium]|nr:sulfatase-like hydrolase/transferase [Candidatus Hydrogenedentota bacterium]